MKGTKAIQASPIPNNKCVISLFFFSANDVVCFLCEVVKRKAQLGRVRKAQWYQVFLFLLFESFLNYLI